ncbi:hypothetical protein NPIL_137061 [Nephila pilipes]|uniref:Uncharacterized protein n=1 Tax=Nephila pilipes TaxID=299642 RepID=A0A8X6NIF0_NEPPI|nr:hypothetical protein NPIL_137061 [Nephila pilipes]
MEPMQDGAKYMDYFGAEYESTPVTHSDDKLERLKVETTQEAPSKGETAQEVPLKVETTQEVFSKVETTQEVSSKVETTQKESLEIAERFLLTTSLKRKMDTTENQIIIPQKIRITMVSETYPVGSKIGYYAHFRQQRRQQQRLQGYAYLHQGRSTVMADPFSLTIYNYPIKNLRPNIIIENDDQMQYTWKLAMNMEKPKSNPKPQ